MFEYTGNLKLQSKANFNMSINALKAAKAEINLFDRAIEDWTKHGIHILDSILKSQLPP